MKLTQFGRMRRRIKCELDEARRKNTLTSALCAQQLSVGQNYMRTVASTIITAKIFAAWKKSLTDELPGDPDIVFNAVPVRGVPFQFVDPVIEPAVTDPEERLP